MKKLILFGVASLLATASFAYTPGDGDRKNTIEIQGKGLANSTFLFNKNISDAGDGQNYAAGWGFNYGAGFTMYFGNIGFGVEGLLGNHRGAYAGTQIIKDAAGNVLSTNDYSSNVNLKITQIPVFFKLKSEIGGYLEVGPQYNIISSATYHFTTDGSTMDTVMTNNFAKSYFSAVLGFGFKIPVAKSHFGIMAGLRLQYAFTDIKGVDATGTPFSDFFKYKDGPQTTSAATAGLTLGVVYTIGEKKKDK